MFNSPAALFLALLVWHLIADFLFQSRAIADGKRERGMSGIAILTLHGFVHGVGTSLILGSFWVAILETVAHATVDWGKCRGYYGLLTDQCIHVFCLGCWLVLLGKF
jgi:hypothetical protein